MPWGSPVAQLREFVLAMRAAWHSWAPASHWLRQRALPAHLDAADVRPAPHDFGAPPVLLAGVGDGMTTMAGEVGDGFLCHAFSTGRWIRDHTIPALTAGREQVGKSLEDYIVKARSTSQRARMKTSQRSQ